MAPVPYLLVAVMVLSLANCEEGTTQLPTSTGRKTKLGELHVHKWEVSELPKGLAAGMATCKSVEDPQLQFQALNLRLLSELRSLHKNSNFSLFYRRCSIARLGPVWGLLPKRETGAAQFLSRYPEYDGRGITIAIFDSGVDPGAAGLQKTSDGKVKIIERHDCSGAGDVDTSTVVEAVNGEIKGLSGRMLKIPENWNNPTNKYHIGLKNAYELYPKDSLERIKKQRKEKTWDPLHKAALAVANKELQEYELKNSNNNLDGIEKLVKEELEAKVSGLISADKKFKDLGPTYDCIVFHDGTMWRACVDTTEVGQLDKASLLGEYSLTYDYAVLTKEDQLNYSINVHNKGNLLEIVSICSSHGTHVASIAAACFPEEPEKNGLAPGAQIISCSIGDGRIHAMETGTALVRAMTRAMQKIQGKPIHIINTSYGEHAKWTSSGRICELMSEVINKHGITWVASANNEGPALCTIGTPPDITTNSIISVGAYVSPDMMVAEYSLRKKMPGMPYTWSSRGPTIDGDTGVTVCAPGGAITSVPTCTLTGCQLLNGTSMAAPHVTGAIAILLSGMEQRNLKYSPHSIKRALQNGALFLQNVDPLAQGSGLLQVEKTFEYLVSYHNAIERDVRFSIQCGPEYAKGIHMRTGQDKPKEWLLRIKPEFFEECEPEEKLKFDMKLALICSEPWMQVPSHLHVMNSLRTIYVRVDPTFLSDGVHITTVRAYDVTNPEKGAVFQVQITVIKATKITNPEQPDLYYSNVQFLPNAIKRHFVLVPSSATWAVLKLKCAEGSKTGKYMIQTVQLRPKLDCKKLKSSKVVYINSATEVTHSFAVKGDLVLEVVIAKFWDSYGEMTMDYSLEFHGIKPDTPAITMLSSDGIHSFEVTSGARVDRILPIITLKQHVLILKPTESTISTLTNPRDIVPLSRYVYENVLTYNFHMNKGCEIIPHSPMLCELLYESEFDSQLWMLFDSNKQYLATGDAYPEKYVIKVEKGDYVIRMHVRHEKKDVLEKLSDLPLLISQKMSNPINMDVYFNETDAIIGMKKTTRAILPSEGQMIPLYIAPLAPDKISKLPTVGQYFTGTITFTKDESINKVDSYPFKYVVTEPGKKSKNSSREKKEKTKLEEYNEAITELQMEWLGKMEPGKEANALYEQLISSNPDNVAVHSAMLQCLEPSEIEKGSLLPFLTKIPEITKKEEFIERNKMILSIADKVINGVDKELLLSYSGTVTDVGAYANTTKTQMDKQKNALIDAYCRKGCALCRLHYLESPTGVDDTGDGADDKEPNVEEINNIWKEVMKFIDPNDSKVIYFMMWHSAVMKHYGRLVKYLLKLNDDKLSLAIDLKLIEAYQKLEWKHCEEFLSGSMLVKYPPAYRLF